MKPSLMLNMIVRNESARIERCLASALPYVKAVVILDTGSTDDTIPLINKACAAAGVHCLVEKGEFKNFSQARNEAWAAAKLANGRGGLPFCQFALLMDADMELVVADRGCFADLNATALSYDMVQKAGCISYANRRIVNLFAKDNIYVGVTHEYIDVDAAGMISGAMFVDHADGSNRTDKYARDAALFEADLLVDPNNGRTWYYLGNTYRDGNEPDKAIKAYKQRISMGGWDEETHSAMMNLAFAYKDAGDADAFVSNMITAYTFRPQRIEPLYDLAKYYREKGDNAAALIFAKMGLNKPRPNDLLFVNDFVYDHGMRYEYSVVGYYDEAERDKTFTVMDDLALDKSCPGDIRGSCHSNLFWHLKPLSHYCPSFKGVKLDFVPPAGYTPMNPSVIVHDTDILCNIRCVNYTINNLGQYMIGPNSCWDAPIDTRNFLVTLDSDLKTSDPAEILWYRPLAAWNMVMGLEDIRLNVIDGDLCYSATAREQLASGECQMWWGKIKDDPNPGYKITTDSKPISDGRSTEKNWMPFLGEKKFVYKPNVIVENVDNFTAAVVPSKLPNIYTEDLRGSSQVIPFKMGHLAVTHEASVDPTNNKRTYRHRFVWFDQDGALHRISLPFVFYDRQIEFCAGLAYHPNNHDLLISFGVRDAEAHVATVSIEEVSRMIWKYT